MSILGFAAIEEVGAPGNFSAVVTPPIIFRQLDSGINVTNDFVATPAGVGPYTYLWSSADNITPNAPAASSCSYTINTALASPGPNPLTCTVTDTSNGQTFAAEFSIVMVARRGRLDL